MLPSTERFSTRVENYIKYRPSYPAAVLELMRVKCGLAATSKVADVGSGTGILTELLLETGATVFAIEPNKEMREAAERLLSDYGRFRSVDGTAERTTLPEASVDLITASQAFHWFDVPKSRRELARILKPQGWVALIWNERPVDAGAFLDEYDALLRRHAGEYDRVTNMRADEGKIREFFGRTPASAVFANRQTFDFPGLEGRLMSSSYAPEAGHPEHEPMIAGLRDLFDRHNRSGKVIFPYRTGIFRATLDLVQRGVRVNSASFVSVASLTVALATQACAAPLPPVVDAAITTDPARDPAHPATMYQLAVPVHDVTVFGVFYRASGGDPHPTAVLLHGLPGFEQNGDLAQTIRRAGWNVLIFHYRGSWASGGTFSFANCVEDIHVVLDYLRASANAARLGIDSRRLALIGHSMGGFVAGIGAMRDEAVLGVAMISGWNPGVFATNPSAQLDQQQLEEFRGDVGPLAGTTAEMLLDEAKKNAVAWDLASHAALWRSRPVLVVESDDFLHADDVAVAAAARKNPGAQVTEVQMTTDHSYSDHRIALASTLLGWLKQLEPSRTPRHSDRVRGTLEDRR